MIRTSIATAVALCLQASAVSAQTQHFTVSTPSASVYKAPTNVSPVIGQATQGATLEVTRDVGSWLKVAWSQAPDGVGYVRKSAGTVSVLGPAVTPNAGDGIGGIVAAVRPQRPVPRRRRPVRPRGPRRRLPPDMWRRRTASALAARLAAPRWAPASACADGRRRSAWASSSTSRGIRCRTTCSSPGCRPRSSGRGCCMRSATACPTAPGCDPTRAPACTWRATTVTDPATALSMSDTGMAAQLFGGTEVTLAAMPRLGLSADVGYQWYQTPFDGYALDGVIADALGTLVREVIQAGSARPALQWEPL